MGVVLPEQQARDWLPQLCYKKRCGTTANNVFSSFNCFLLPLVGATKPALQQCPCNCLLLQGCKHPSQQTWSNHLADFVVNLSDIVFRKISRSFICTQVARITGGVSTSLDELLARHTVLQLRFSHTGCCSGIEHCNDVAMQCVCKHFPPDGSHNSVLLWHMTKTPMCACWLLSHATVALTCYGCSHMLANR